MILGIDFGSTNSYVTVIPKKSGGKPLDGAVCINGNPNIPTVYAYENGKELFGSEARESKGIVVSYVKSYIRDNPDKLDKLIDPSVPVTYGDVVRRFIGYLIELTRKSTKKILNESIEYVTITYPTCLSESGMQSTSYSKLIRNAVIDATGLDEDHVFAREEALAAAYSFVYDRRRDNNTQDRKILVFDLGGGTLDLALINCSSDYEMKVLSTGGMNIGGRKWTMALATLLETVSDTDFAEDDWWYDLAEEMKIILSGKDGVPPKEEAYLRKTTPLPDNKNLDMTITRQQFEKTTKPLFNQCESHFSKILESCNLTSEDIDYFVLVGGGCYMPRVQRFFKELPGGSRKVIFYKPDQAVSLGAALWTLDEARPPGVELGPVVEEIASHTYGIEVVRPGKSDYAQVKNLIFKGDRFSSGRVFVMMDECIRPRRVDQKNVDVIIYESNLSREDCDEDGFVQISKRTVPIGGDKIRISIPRGYRKATDFKILISMELYSDNRLGITVKDAQNKRILYNNLKKVESGCSNE